MRLFLSVLLFGLTAFCAAAHAGVPSDALQRLDAAVAAFGLLKEKTQAQGRLPQLSRPDEEKVLEALWDEQALLGRPPYSQRDLSPLERITGAERQAMLGYVFVDGKQPTEESMSRYGNEVFRFQAFSLQASVDTFAGLAELWARLRPDQRTEVRKRGLRQMRLGLQQALESFTSALGLGISEQTKQVLAQTLSRNAPVIAEFSPLAQRQIYAAIAEDALPSIPTAFKPDVEAFIKAMSITTCTGLCEVQ